MITAPLYDQDPQGTARVYADAGHLPFAIESIPPSSRPDADLVIIDHEASDWTVPPSKLLLMPVKPSRVQFSTYLAASKRARAAGRTIITVVTDGNAHRQTERAVMDALRGMDAHVIPSSGVFSRAADDYRRIFDEALDTAYKIRERRREINEILGAVLMTESTDASAAATTPSETLSTDTDQEVAHA